MSIITYDLRKSPVAPGRTDGGYFPVAVGSNPITEGMLYETISHRTTLEESDIKGALSALADIIAEQLSQGNTVNIPELGTFSLSLTSDRKIETADDKQAADHIHVAAINFRAKKALHRRMRSVTFHRTRYPRTGTERADTSEAKELIADYSQKIPMRY